MLVGRVWAWLGVVRMGLKMSLEVGPQDTERSSEAHGSESASSIVFFPFHLIAIVWRSEL